MLGARHDRCHVRPVLEQLAVVEGVGEHRAGVRSETGEQRQLLAAYEHVDGVDLDHADAVEHLAQVTAVDAAGGRRSARPWAATAIRRAWRRLERSTSSVRGGRVAEVLDGREEAAGVVVGTSIVSAR